MVKASAFEALNSALIPSPVKPISLKLVFTASFFDAYHQRDSVENKPASLLVLLGKAISVIHHFKVIQYNDASVATIASNFQESS